MDKVGWARIIKAVVDERHQPRTDVRHPMLEMGDKLGTLRSSVGSEPSMRADRSLGGLLQELQQAYDAVRVHLDANYRWD